MPYQAVLFDLDGTLIDTAADFVITLEKLCAAHRVEAPTPIAIRNTVSDGARALIKLAFGIDDQSPRLELLRQELLDIYEQELGANAPVFDEIAPALAIIQKRQIPWGIVTNKPRKYTELLLARIGLEVPAVVCPCDVSQAKPDPEGLFLAAKQLGVAANQCLYFGDHERDIIAGKAASMATAACSWGYISAKRIATDWQATITCNNADDAIAALNLEH